MDGVAAQSDRRASATADLALSLLAGVGAGDFQERLALSLKRHVKVDAGLILQLDDPALADVAATVQAVGLDGVIATNTTVQRPGASAAAAAQGGLSGAPLKALALQMVSKLRGLLGPSVPIIGVGGIDSPAAALAMRAAGADLVQLYTGLVFRGPALVAHCVAALSAADRASSA